MARIQPWTSSTGDAKKWLIQALRALRQRNTYHSHRQLLRGRLNPHSEFQRVRITDAEAAQFATVNGETTDQPGKQHGIPWQECLVKGLTEPTVYEFKYDEVSRKPGKIVPEFLVELFSIQHF